MTTRRRPAAPLADEAEDVARVLGFVNTLAARGSAAPDERLPHFGALVDWARGAHVIGGATAGRLVADAERYPQRAAAALARARQLREALDGLFTAVAAGKSPSADVLETLAHHLAESVAESRLVMVDGTLQWVSSSEESLNLVMWEVANSAGRLVASSRLGYVRACAAIDCGWWFVDDTRNHSRRWCEMKSCGNREKLRRFRARQQNG